MSISEVFVFSSARRALASTPPSNNKMTQISEMMCRAYVAGDISPPQQKPVRLYKLDEDTGAYAFLKEYDNMTQAGKDNGCTTLAVNKICKKQRDELPNARIHAKSVFFKTHVFRLSETDDLA